MAKAREFRAKLQPVGHVVIGLLVAVLFTTASVVVSASPAAAAPGCYGSGCAGLNPAQFGCDADGVTVRTLDVPGGTIQLRYSPSCRANWARATYGGTSYVQPHVWNPGGPSFDWVQYNSAWRWTRMVNGLITR